MMKNSERIGLGLFGLFVMGGLWHLGVIVTASRVFPSPVEVAAGLVELAEKGLLASYAADSLRRVAFGYGAAVLLGVPLGILLGWIPSFGRAFNPLIQMMRPISPLAWMPLAVIWFGVSDLAPVFLIFLSAFFSIVVSAMNAVRNVPAVYLQAGRNFGMSRLGMLRRVVFPAILPRLLTGLRLALGIAWVVVVAAEMIAVNSGLGYLIIDSRNAGKRYDLVVAGMLLIGAIGLLLDVILRRVERMRVVRWGFGN